LQADARYCQLDFFLAQLFPIHIPPRNPLNSFTPKDQIGHLAKMRQCIVGKLPHEFIASGANLVLAT